MNPEPVLPGVVVIEGHVQGLANARALGRAGIPVIAKSTLNVLIICQRNLLISLPIWHQSKI
jgi:hypothetical protein